MDLMTVFGIMVGGAAIYYVMHQAEMVGMLLNLEAAILIFGGTIGAMMITFPWRTIKQVPRALMIVFFPPKRISAIEALQTIVDLSEKAKKNGIQSLKDELNNLQTPFLIDGLKMIIDEYETDMIKEKLEREILLIRRRHQQVANVFRTMGISAPIFGLLGTLLGVVRVLRSITDPQTMGASMALAMMASFYGIFSANFVFLPITGKLNTYSEDEIITKEVIVKGLLSIQKGELPVVIAKKLEAYISFRMRQKELLKGKKTKY